MVVSWRGWRVRVGGAEIPRFVVRDVDLSRVSVCWEVQMEGFVPFELFLEFFDFGQVGYVLWIRLQGLGF